MKPLLLIIALLVSSHSQQTVASSVSFEAGKKSYDSLCQACHGNTALGNASLGSPALASQIEVYTQRQIALFASGHRGKADSFAAQMAPMAGLLSTQADIINVSAYLASLPNSQRFETDGDRDNGYKYYQGSCGGCHGSEAQGNPRLKAPRLAGIDPAYLKRQYQHYLIGKRGAEPDNRLGRQMAMMAASLTDPAHINDVFAYIASMQPKAQTSAK